MTVQQIEAFRETRCIVIDEISFAGYAGFLKKLSDKLQRYSEDSEVPYGSFDIFFTGDFLQLQPCNRYDILQRGESFVGAILDHLGRIGRPASFQ